MFFPVISLHQTLVQLLLQRHETLAPWFPVLSLVFLLFFIRTLSVRLSVKWQTPHNMRFSHSTSHPPHPLASPHHTICYLTPAHITPPLPAPTPIFVCRRPSAESAAVTTAQRVTSLAQRLARAADTRKFTIEV